MFWCDKVKSGIKFCVCQGSWSQFRIISSEVYSDILKVYFTAENGTTCLIFSQRQGEPFPTNLDTQFHFKPLQHVRIIVEGGDITLAGEAFDGAMVRRSDGYFLPNCPFGEEDDWRRPEKQKDTVSQASKGPSAEERLKIFEESINQMILQVSESTPADERLKIYEESIDHLTDIMDNPV